MLDYIRSIKQLEKFDKTKDTRRNIELKKVSDDITKIPTDVDWDNIEISHSIAKTIPANLSCKRIRIEDNRVITTINTNAKIVVVSKCYSLKKIIAPNCHTLVIDSCDNVTSIPENNYIMFSYFGGNSRAVPIPKNSTIEKITVHKAIIKKDIVVTDSVCLKDCVLDKKNLSISGKHVYIDKVKNTDSTVTISCADEFYITDSDINISKKSSFKNIIISNNLKKNTMSYDFISGRTLDSCAIVTARNGVSFPENLTINKTVKSIGLIAPKNIKINDFANICVDKNWTHIPGHTKKSVYNSVTVSYECAGSMKNIIATETVNIDITNSINKKIKLNTLICNHLSINSNPYDPEVEIEIPKEHIIMSRDGMSSVLKNTYYKCDGKKINMYDGEFKKIIWNDHEFLHFDINKIYDIPLENFLIPNIKGISIIDGISTFFTNKRVVNNRTFYINNVCNSDKHIYVRTYDTKYAISEVQPDNSVINTHGHSYRDAIDSLERKKNYHYKYNCGSIIDKYKSIPKDMPLEKDFCIKMYRDLTGACAAGVDQFIRHDVKNVEKTYTINDIIEMTKNKYGHDRFVRAFE